jgi:hypothetical protein
LHLNRNADLPIHASASINVPSTVKCSSDITSFGRYTTGRKNLRAMSWPCRPPGNPTAAGSVRQAAG